MRVLITGGGCEEPIDGVRYVSNFSTGRTSVFLAQELAAAGHDVTAVLSARAADSAGLRSKHCMSAPALAAASDANGAGRLVLHAPGSLRVVPFRTFNDLSLVLKNELSSTVYDAVIHAAAVSDYGIESVTVEGTVYAGGGVPKIPSGRNVSVSFCIHPKLIDSLRVWSCSPSVKIAAFKLTNTAAEEERQKAVLEILTRPAHDDCASAPADIVVHNDLSEISDTEHPFTVYEMSRACTGQSEQTGETGRACTYGQSKQCFSIAVCACGRTKHNLSSFFKEYLV